MEKIIAAIAVRRQVEEYHSFNTAVDKNLAYGELVRLVALMDGEDLDAMGISSYDKHTVAEKYRQEADTFINE